MCSRMIRFLQPGKYTINVTAFNLHSNELYGYNKFINNMTRCCFSIYAVNMHNHQFPGRCLFRNPWKTGNLRYFSAFSRIIFNFVQAPHRWLDQNGSYIAFLVYSNNSVRPTKADVSDSRVLGCLEISILFLCQHQVECNWGDGSPSFTGELDKITPEPVSFQAYQFLKICPILGWNRWGFEVQS